MISKNLEAFLQISQLAYESNSEDLVHVSNLAAALLLKRENPERARQLTTRLMDTQGDFLPYRLNHIHALIQANQLKAADKMLNELAALEKPAPLEADYELALFELAVARNNGKEIASRRKLLKTEHMFPETVVWINEWATPFLE